jgi:hypothetical protein
MPSDGTMKRNNDVDPKKMSFSGYVFKEDIVINTKVQVKGYEKN